MEPNCWELLLFMYISMTCLHIYKQLLGRCLTCSWNVLDSLELLNFDPTTDWIFSMTNSWFKKLTCISLNDFIWTTCNFSRIEPSKIIQFFFLQSWFYFLAFQKIQILALLLSIYLLLLLNIKVGKPQVQSLSKGKQLLYP